MIKKRDKKRASFFLRNPRLPGFLTICYVLFGLIVPLIIIYSPSIGNQMSHFFGFVSFILISGPIVLTILQILNFKHSLASIRGLAMLYLEIIFMFGVIYFYAASDISEADLKEGIHADNKTPAIRGINTDWRYLLHASAIKDRAKVVDDMLECFHDSIHFSLITSTTVGYGDMTPSSPVAKFLVEIQVLVSFFLISFGVAYFFSSQRTPSKANELVTIKARLDALEKQTDMDSKKSHTDLS